MLGSPNDSYTPCGVTRSARCHGCGSVDGEVFAFPATNATMVMCLECIRGMVGAVTRELMRRRETGIVKA